MQYVYANKIMQYNVQQTYVFRFKYVIWYVIHVIYLNYK